MLSLVVHLVRQDLSVAGKRAGLEGARSGLFMEQIRLIKEMRKIDEERSNRRADEPIRPRFMVWENVCGAFSSNKGEDFRAVLEETAKIVDETVSIPEPPKGKWTYSGCIMGPHNRWSIAWRTHDAQYFGVPQRRKRIALVADFDGGDAAKILFVGESVSRDIEQGAEEGQGTARNTTESTRVSSYTLKVRGGVEIDSHGKKAGKGALVQEELSGTLGVSQDQTLITGINGDKAGCLDSSYYKGCGERNGAEREVVAYGISAYESNSMKSDNPHSGVYKADTARTLDNNGGNPACNQGGMAVVFNGSSITNPINASNPKPGDACHTLTDDNRNYLCIENHPTDSRVKVSDEDIVQTLTSRMGTGGMNVPLVAESDRGGSSKALNHTLKIQDTI